MLVDEDGRKRVRIERERERETARAKPEFRGNNKRSQQSNKTVIYKVLKIY